MMKKIHAEYAAALLMAALILDLLCGCPNMLNPPRHSGQDSSGEGVAAVSLTAPGDASFAARTVLPRAADLYYTLTFTKGAVTVSRNLDQAASINVSLAPGSWNLAVSGYSDAGRADVVLEGSAAVDVSSGESTSVTVYLSGTAGGSGTIEYEIIFPDDTSAGTLTLQNSDGSDYTTPIDLLDTLDGNSVSTVDNVTTAAGTISSVPGGYYLVLVKLYNDTEGVSAGYIAAVHVYKDSITPIEKEFTGDNFSNYIMVDALNLTSLVTAPLKGAAPDTTFTGNDQYTGSVEWKESDGTTPVSGSFAASTVYKAIVSLNATPGFTFDGVGDDAFGYTGASVSNPAGADESINVTITFPATAAEGLRYVRETAAGLGTGASWAHASSDLQLMIDQARADKAANGSITAIVRVAAGTYYPLYAPGTDGSSIAIADLEGNNRTERDRTFILREGVEIRGGYTAAGDNPSEEDRKARFDAAGEPKSEDHRTVLSGDIDGVPDGGTVDSFTGRSGNAYHVVLGVDIPAGSGTVLDGFTIRGGNADAGTSSITVNMGNGARTVYRSNGGGMLNNSSSPVLTNVTIEGNSATAGGGMLNNSSSPVLTNVTIEGNSAGTGGGMNNSSSSPVLTSVTIAGNSTGSYGHGMLNSSSSPVLTNVTIAGNSSSGSGGCMSNYTSSPVLTNVTIAGNSNSGMYNNNSSPKNTKQHHLGEFVRYC